jgi:hypothetical protein
MGPSRCFVASVDLWNLILSETNLFSPGWPKRPCLAYYYHKDITWWSSIGCAWFKMYSRATYIDISKGFLLCFAHSREGNCTEVSLKRCSGTWKNISSRITQKATHELEHLVLYFIHGNGMDGWFPDDDEALYLLALLTQNPKCPVEGGQVGQSIS